MRTNLTSSQRQHAPRVSLNEARVLLGVAVGTACFFDLYVPMMQSPLSSDKKNRNFADDRIQHLALQANLPPPKVTVHLSLPYTLTAGTLGIQSGPAWAKPEIRISLHRDFVTQLPIDQLDCLLGHELGHIALREQPHSTIFARSGRNESELAKLWGHHEEYAADWFGAQLCGKENMISLLTGELNSARHPDGNQTSKYRHHPLNVERVENLLLSNQTFMHLGTQMSDLHISDIKDFTTGLFKSDGEFHFSQIAVIGILSYAVFKKHRHFFSRHTPATHRDFNI